MSDSKASRPRQIRRRDFVHGVALAGASALVPGRSLADSVAAATSAVHPPSLTGMRGNHPGSWEIAHQVGRAGQRDWGTVAAADDEAYDLVVVGAGISGLAAAYFFQKAQPGARILLLDNHDDFGGHAKRNEFSVDGRQLIAYGGSQSMEAPSGYPAVVKALLDDLAVDLPAFDDAYDQDFYRRSKLEGGVFFNKRDWGSSRMVKANVGGLSDFIPLLETRRSPAEVVGQMPLSVAAKKELLRLFTESRDCMPDIPADEKRAYLDEITYAEFLKRHLDIREEEVFRLLKDLAWDTGVSIDAAPAGEALFYSVLPGRKATGIPPDPETPEPYIHHFPDGNASIARLLVRRLIPAAAAGSNMRDIVTVPVAYDRLDRSGSPVRLRLNSTVVNVQHVGRVKKAESVDVTYIREGVAKKVRAASVVMACYHAIIPSLCPELPRGQKDAMSLQVKVPILYTNVALRNWRAWKDMGIGAFVAPGCYHINAMLDFPVSMGAYDFARTPEDPVVVHMERFPHSNAPGLSKRERLRAGRHELLRTPFADIEDSIRAELGEALAPGGFDAGRDIAAITVNRWAHGYSYGYGDVEDETYDEWDDPRYPHMRAQRRFGRIAMANSDAAANAMMESAIQEAHRAVGEIL